MDFSESSHIVYGKIQKLDPVNVSKIMGYLLLQDHGEKEMIRLAFGPDNLIQSLINQAYTCLGLSSESSSSSPSVSPPEAEPAPLSDLPLQFTPFSQTSSRSYLSPTAATLCAQNPYWDLQTPADHNLEFGYSETVTDEISNLHNQLQFMSIEDQYDPVNSVGSDYSLNNYYFQEPRLGSRGSRRSPSLPEFPLKVCHYFSKGFCKHGSKCRYFHGHPMAENFPHNNGYSNPASNDIIINEDIFSPGSLEKLEVELTELLKSRRGFPVSIASLPMMYYEKYGRTLQAEGYLTESQRHGKAGYSLTKLLARLKNSIRVIDSYRPHGQHSVVLAEDALKYMDHNGERNEHGGIVAGSRQIYLTFPAESTFTEQDVSNYFSKFGPVQDVRIPCQQKRMFGFVTFVYAETVKQILSKGNPHYVCGARVLVKPYREKSRLVDRKYTEKVQHHMLYGSQFLDAESELHSLAGISENSSLLRKQFMEEHELEQRRFPEMELGAKHLSHNSYFGYSLDELKRSEAHADQTEFPSTERYHHIRDALNNGSSSDEKLQHINTKYNDQDSSQSVNLPDSPFASPIGSGISTVI